MIGLVYKDLMVLKKQLRYYMIFLVVYGGMTVAGMGPGILGAVICIVGMILPMSSIAYDEQARWDKYAAATPAGRAGIVGGKYLFALAVIGGMTALVLLCMVLLHLTGLVEDSLADLVLIALSCGGAALFLNAVTLPLMLKFGAEKSRTISMGLFVVIFGGSALAAMMLKRQVKLPVPPAWLLNALPVVLALLAVGSLAVSYCVARAIYERKEL